LIQPRFSACGYLFRPDTIEHALESTSEAGFVGIEGNDEVIAGMDDAAIRSLSKRAAGLGVPFTTYHLPFARQHDMAAFYETERRAAVEQIRSAMRRASLLGAHTVILHPTTTSFDVGIESAGHYLDRLAASIAELAPFAGESGLRIAVENMMNPERSCYFSLPEHIASFRERVDDPRVGFCLDTGHALISLGPSRQLEMLEAMRGKLIALHLQDTPGDRDIHIAPGHGNVDFAGIAERLRRDGVEEVLCIETAPFAAERPYTAEAFSRLVSETRELFG
jgi:sugar phosphate isomerase/epimerase